MENPKIRFKGFTKDWEQRKFGELYSKVSEKNDLSFGADKIISVANMYFKEEVKESSDEYMRTYNVMRLGDIAFEGNKSKNYSHGRFVENTIGDGIVSHVFDVFRPTTSYDLLFWKYLINNEGVMGRIMARCTNASTMMTNLVASDFLKEKILVPSLKEQKKIGAYFDSLDHLITLHQRKCEQTKKLKKYMLQKMFPRNGAKVPEIRFDGFTYDWEQRKFSDIATRESSISTSTTDVPSVEYEDVIAEEGRLNKDIHLKEAVKSGITFDGSQVLYGKLRPYLHNWLNPDFKGIAVGDWWVLKPINMDKKFLYRLIQTQQFDNIANQSSGSKMPRADWNLISNSEFMVPFSKEEQSKIGIYFDSLDHLITLHQRKCDELKKMKKYMLQNMFI